MTAVPVIPIYAGINGVPTGTGGGTGGGGVGGGTDVDTLAIYDVVAAKLATIINIGIVAASSSDDTLLRVFNVSDTYQAEDVTVSLTGSNEDQLYLSLDGDNFTAAIEVGDIPPGAYSPQFTLRRVTHYQVGDGNYAATLVAIPAAWTNPAGSGISNNIPLDTSDS